MTINALENLMALEIYPDSAPFLQLPSWLADQPSLEMIRVLGGPALDLTELAGAENLTIERRFFARGRIIGADKLGPGSRVIRSPRPEY